MIVKPASTKYYTDIKQILNTLPPLNNESYEYTQLKTAKPKDLAMITNGIHTTQSLHVIDGVPVLDSWHFNLRKDGIMYHVYVLPIVYSDARGNPVLGWQLDPYRAVTSA